MKYQFTFVINVVFLSSFMDGWYVFVCNVHSFPLWGINKGLSYFDLSLEEMCSCVTNSF